MEGFNVPALYCFIAIVLAVIAAANDGFEFTVSAPDSVSGALMVPGTFGLFYLPARII